MPVGLVGTMLLRWSVEMYAILYDALEDVEPAKFGADGLPALRRASAEVLSGISRVTQLRHARYCCVSSAMGEIVGRKLSIYADGNRRAVLTASADPHKAVAKEFGRRLHEAGARSLNPIMFPHTLPSATAVTLGAQFAAHTCSIAFDGGSALQSAMSVASLLLRAGQADTILVFACSGDVAFGVSNPDVELFGIGVLLSRRPFPDRCLLVRQANQHSSKIEEASESVNRFHEARILTKLAIASGDPNCAIGEVTLAGYIFQEHADPSKGEIDRSA